MTDQPQNTIQQVAQAAHPITEQVGQIIQSMRDAAPHVTEALVRLTFAQGVEMLVAAGFAVLLFFFCIFSFNSISSKPIKTDTYGDVTMDAVFSIIKLVGCGLGVIISLSIFFANIGTGIVYTLAPEGQTILNVIAALRGTPQQ